ncbi:MAG TPA: hypothetical protein VM557_12865 [Thermoanaerobaculia bacterium]|nr:hypothetical protein [Thermoanaerobaculia bacterium]
MFKLLGKMLKFRLGQKVTRGAAKKMGLGPMSGLLGLVGGLKAARKH